MERCAEKHNRLCLTGAGFLWGWSFLFFFTSQSESTTVPVFWLGDATYLGTTLCAALAVALRQREGYCAGQLQRIGNTAFALMLAGSALLSLSSLGFGGTLPVVAGKALAGPGQGLFWIAWTTVLSRFDIEKAETAFLQWVPLLAAVLLTSSLVPQTSLPCAQMTSSLLMMALPVAVWMTFCKTLSLPAESGALVGARGHHCPSPARRAGNMGAIIWPFANLSIALAVIMVAWSAFLFRHGPDMAHVKVIFSVGALAALPIVWFALRVTRQFGPSSLYRWAVPLMTLGVMFDFLSGSTTMWSACLCLCIVSVGFEGMYHLVFIYAARRFSQQALFVASMGVTATTLGGLMGSAAWAFCFGRLSTEAMGTVLLGGLFILVLCSSCAPRSEGISGVEQREYPSQGALEGISSIEERCEVLARHYDLTPRELEVLSLLVQGRSRAFIREALFISKGTVDTHVHHIYSKMGIGSKDALASMVFDDCELTGSIDAK